MKIELIILFFILFIVNLKWVFLFLLYPSMVINARNKGKKLIYKILAGSYLISERIFRGRLSENFETATL